MIKEEIVFAMRSIRSHLEATPHAADTIDGVHSFWIAWPEPIPTQATTFEALQRLEAEGQVRRTTAENREIWSKANYQHPPAPVTQ
jgi:hypothetical protein